MSAKAQAGDSGKSTVPREVLASIGPEMAAVDIITTKVMTLIREPDRRQWPGCTVCCRMSLRFQ